MAVPFYATAQDGRDWTKLPDDVTASILVLSNLGAFDILTEYQMVCKTWRRVFCNYPILWRTIDYADLQDSPFPYMICRDYFRNEKCMEKMCRNAIDRSCGNLVDITLQGDYGTDDLLKYMTGSCSGIRRLTLDCCDITDEGLKEVASKLPLLEDLDFSDASLSHPHKTVEAIGQSCPLLKSFSWKKNLEIDTEGLDDDYAKAISGTMHGLHHLSLFGFYLTNDALKEIVDCCPHLESLDLESVRIKHFRSIRRDLEKKMRGRIKKLKLPPVYLTVALIQITIASLFLATMESLRCTILHVS